MAGTGQEPRLSPDEENVLLNQSDSDVEYEDATDELPSEGIDLVSQKLEDELTLATDGATDSPNLAVGDSAKCGGESGPCSGADAHDTVTNSEHPVAMDDCEQFLDANHSTDKDSAASSSESDEDAEEDDPVAAAEKDAGDLEGEGKDHDEVIIDEEVIRQREAAWTEEEREAKKEEAQTLKAKGNELFRDKNYEAAIESYTDALMACPMCYAKERSIMYSNRAACKYKMEKYDSAIEDSSKALEINPAYMKALLRRAELYEKTEKLDEALVDYQKVVEMDPSIHQARAACMRLPDQITERNEKMKAEMMGKLKDLGNMILKPFGMSTDNFQLQQDPNTGGYSVNFQQNQQGNS